MAAPQQRSLTAARWRWIGIAVSAAFFFAYAALSGYMGHTLTTTTRHPFQHFPDAYGLRYEDVSFASRDSRLLLSGWLIAPSERSVSLRPAILVHGWTQDRQSELDGHVLEIAAHLAERGHWVLLFDLHGWGRSAGSRFSLGPAEARDVRGAIDFLTERGLADRGVDLMGFSMGGAAVLLAAGDDERIGAVVEDSAFAELWPVLDRSVPGASGLPGLFTPGAVLAASALTGTNLYAVRPLSVAAGLHQRGVGLLVIHGEADDLVPVGHGRRIAAAFGKGVSTLFVPGAEHVRAYVANPTQYLRRVDGLLERADGSV